ncbi:MAG: ammonium transporter, partial [Chlorobiota bacterium]
AGFVTIGQSLFIGTVASLISNFAVSLKSKTTLDDTLDVFPCHGLGGITGMIATAIFAKEVGLIYGETTTFFNHLIALAIVTVFAFTGSAALYYITNLLTPLRVQPEMEESGLDLSQHGESTMEPGTEWS